MIRWLSLFVVMVVLVGCSSGGSAILVYQGTVQTERDARTDLRTRFVEYPEVWGTVCRRSEQASNSQNAALVATVEATLTPALDKTEDASFKRAVQIEREECVAHDWGTPLP